MHDIEFNPNIEYITKKFKWIMKTNLQLPYKNEFLQNLKALNDHEKKYIREYFTKKCKWKLGSGKCIELLEIAEILTFTEYFITINMCSADDADADADDDAAAGVECLIAALCEREFHLLAQLIWHINLDDSISETINNYLERIYLNVIHNLDNNSNYYKINYLKAIQPYTNDDCLKTCELLHLRLFLTIGNKSTITEAITNQKLWNTNYPKQTTMESFLLSVIRRKELVLEKIFQEIRVSSTFSGWKYFIYILRAIHGHKTNDKHLHIIKEFLNDILREFRNRKSNDIFFIMILIARQVYFYNHLVNHCEVIDKDEYTQWYRKTIGEMKYTLHKDTFTLAMTALIDMMKYENDCDIVQIHGNTKIIPVPDCESMILIYKNMCESFIPIIPIVEPPERHSDEDHDSNDDPMDVDDKDNDIYAEKNIESSDDLI